MKHKLRQSAQLPGRTAMPATARNADRKPIIWAVGMSRLKEVLRDIAPSYAGRADIHIIDRGFDEALEEIRQRQRISEVDVLVAAGSNGEFLRRQLSLPVTLVKPTGF